MESISQREIEAIDNMLNRYTEHFDLDELNEEEEHATMYDRVSDISSKMKPEPVEIDPKRLHQITDEEKASLHDLIMSLIQIFESSGITFEEHSEFEALCRFYKRLDPAWEAPKCLRIELRP